MQIGIDFGTSYSFFALKDNNGVVRQIGTAYSGDYIPPYKSERGKGRRADKWKGIRTCIASYEEGEKWCIGAECYERGIDNVCTDMKTRLREECLHNTIYSWGPGMTFDFLACKFFHMVFCKAVEDIEITQASSIESIVIGMPARGDGNEAKYRNKLIDIVQAAIKMEPEEKNVKDRWFANNQKVSIQVREEPFLASLAFLRDAGDSHSHNNICVIDIGGGTADCTFINKAANGNGVYYVSKCAGGRQPAGGDIDEMLKRAIHNSYRVKLEVNDNTAIMVAKEKLFANPGREDVRISVNATNSSDYKDWFLKYKKVGRRSTISLQNVKEDPLVLVYNQEHRKATQYGLSGKNLDYCAYECVDFCKTVDLKQVFLSNESVIETTCEWIKKDKPDAIVFAGGTCGIHELRKLICDEAGISLAEDDLFTKDKVEGKYANDGKKVIVYSLCNATNITGSNAIAYGGAYLNESDIDIYDKPYDIKCLACYYDSAQGYREEVLIRPDSRNAQEPIMDFNVMYDNRKMSDCSNHQKIRLFDPECNVPPVNNDQYWRNIQQFFNKGTTINTVNGEVDVRFAFKIEGVRYPVEGTYGVSIGAPIVYNNKVTIHVLCDYRVATADHRVYLMVECEGNQTIRESRHNVKYTFEDYCGETHTINLNNIIEMGNSRGYIRQYIIGKDSGSKYNIIEKEWTNVKYLNGFKEENQ